MITQGLKIIVSEDYPKISLSKCVFISDNLREEMNSWLANRFGYFNLLEDGQFVVNKREKSVVCNPRTYHQIKKILIKIYGRECAGI